MHNANQLSSSDKVGDCEGLQLTGSTLCCGAVCRAVAGLSTLTSLALDLQGSPAVGAEGFSSLVTLQALTVTYFVGAAELVRIMHAVKHLSHSLRHLHIAPGISDPHTFEFEQVKVSVEQFGDITRGVAALTRLRSCLLYTSPSPRD